MKRAPDPIGFPPNKYICLEPSSTQKDERIENLFGEKIRWSEIKSSFLVSKNFFEYTVKKLVVEKIQEEERKQEKILSKISALFPEMPLPERKAQSIEEQFSIREHIQNKQVLILSIQKGLNLLKEKRKGISFKSFEFLLSLMENPSSLEEKFPQRKSEKWLVQELVKKKEWEIAFALIESHQLKFYDEKAAFDFFFQQIILLKGWSVAVDLVCDISSLERQKKALQGLIQASFYRKDLSSLEKIEEWSEEIDTIIQQIEEIESLSLVTLKQEKLNQKICLTLALWTQVKSLETEANFISFISSILASNFFNAESKDLSFQLTSCLQEICYDKELVEISEELEKKILRFLEILPIALRKNLVEIFPIVLVENLDCFLKEKKEFPLLPGMWRLICSIKRKFTTSDNSLSDVLFYFFEYGIYNSDPFIHQIEEPNEEFQEFPFLILQELRKHPDTIYAAVESICEREKISFEQGLFIHPVFVQASDILIALHTLFLQAEEEKLFNQLIGDLPTQWPEVVRKQLSGHFSHS